MSTRSALGLSAGLLLAAAAVDWVTGPEIALSIVYLIPIALATWKVGRWPGLGVAVTCGLVWVGVELLTNKSYSNPAIPIWNALVRAGFFSLVSWLTAEVIERKRVERSLRQVQEKLEQRVRERTAELQMLNSTLEEKVEERSAAAEERAQKLAISREDLRKQTSILQSILNSMGDGVIVADSTGGLILMNPAVRRILRIPSQDTDEQAWRDFQGAHPSERLSEQSAFETCLLLAMRGEAFDRIEVFVRHRNFPEGIWLSVTGRPLRDHQERTSGSVLVFGDITARKQLERQIAEVSDREQRRIGQDLHDGLCQHLVSTAFAARNLAAKLADSRLPEEEDASAIAELLSQSVAQARDVARGLHPVQLEAGGLASALDDLAMKIRPRLSCEFVDQTSSPVLEQSLVTNLFRIAQEAVTNAVKHARARHITITLSGGERELGLRIEDDGSGMESVTPAGGGMGLHIMNYRARMIGATLQIDSRPGGGTAVKCTVRRSALTDRSHAWQH